MHTPWLGVVIAGAGVILLWMATQSMAWIDSAENTWTLSELGFTAEALGQFRIVRWYADWGWKLVAAYVVFVAVLSTLVNLTSSAARTLLWLPIVGPFAFFNLTDRKGTAAPRVLGALAMLAPAAVLGAVWVDLLVEPEVNPSVEIPSDLDLENLDQEDLANGDDLPDQETLQELADMRDAGSVDLDDLAALGVDWRGYGSDEIGSGLWMSFAALAVVAAGAVVGTRAAKR